MKKRLSMPQIFFSIFIFLYMNFFHEQQGQVELAGTADLVN